MRSLLVLALSICLLSSHSFAEDDLLQILEGGGASLVNDEGLIHEKNELTVALRKTLKNTTAEQNIFLDFLAKGDYSRAMYQFDAAFRKTSFKRSASGTALLSYLYLKNGLTVLAVENLFTITNPKAILPEVAKMWTLQATVDLEAWERASLSWKDKWNAIFAKEIGIKVLANELGENLQANDIMSLLRETKAKSKNREFLEWRMVLSLALQEDYVKAVKVLSHLMKTSKGLVSKDLMNISAARMLYSKGFLQAAVEYYQKVSKGSEYWFLAQEEMAWAYIRKGEPQNVLAITRSLMPKHFSALVGSEAVFLRAIAQLKVCDYTGVQKSIVEFKTRFKKRSQELSMASQGKYKNEMHAILERLKTEGRIEFHKFGKDARFLPRYITRDEALFRLLKQQSFVEKEAATAEALYAQSLNQSSAKVGFEAKLGYLKSWYDKKLQGLKAAQMALMNKRIKFELNEIANMLQKMHIVEAELLQQVELADLVKNKAGAATDAVKKGSTGSKDLYSVSFPFDGELWFDEISNYKVNLKKDCRVARK